MKRTLLLVMTVLIIAAFAMPQGGASAAQQQATAQMGKGKPPKPPQTEFAAQVKIDDSIVGNQLKSDGLIREDPSILDADFDGFGDLTGPNIGLPIFYQDHRIGDDLSMGPFPDPCVGARFGDGGSVQFDLDRGNANTEGFLGKNCNVVLDYTTDPPSLFADDPATPLGEADGRTVTLEFIPETADEGDPAKCACDHFKFLLETSPESEWGAGTTWGTEFKWIDVLDPEDENDTYDESLGCRVTPSAGAILSDGFNQTANVGFFSHPFKTA